MADERITTGSDAVSVPADLPDDDPYPGDWIDCWQCDGDGGWEGDDPLWDLGEWYRCDICRGKGGWKCEATGPANA